MSSVIRRLIARQMGWCQAIDNKLFGSWAVDGNQWFLRYVRQDVPDGAAIAEIGGGKNPIFRPEDVSRRGLVVVGVDIDVQELAAAPEGAYARTVVSAVEDVRGTGDQDYVIARSVLEHVTDGALAAKGIASFAAPDATIVTFCPCRRAIFARLNRLLPETVKRTILFHLFPATRDGQGFPAFYHDCTPAELERNMRDNGIVPVQIKYFYASSYFMFLSPLYVCWRIATYPFMKLWPTRYCETFVFIGKKTNRS